MTFYHLIFSAFLCTENQELKNLSLRSGVKGVKADTLSRMPSVLRSIGFAILILGGWRIINPPGRRLLSHLKSKDETDFTVQPITPFQSTGKHLKTVFITIQPPPGEHIFAVQRPAFADGEFDLDVGHQGSVEQQICFQGKQGATVSTNRQGILLFS